MGNISTEQASLCKHARVTNTFQQSPTICSMLYIHVYSLRNKATSQVRQAYKSHAWMGGLKLKFHCGCPGLLHNDMLSHMYTYIPVCVFR